MIENVLNANDLNSNSIFSWDSIHARRGRSVFNYIHYARTGSTVIKMLLTIDERGSKTDRNSVFDCHLSPVGR